MEDDHKLKNFLVTKGDGWVNTKFVGDNLEVCLPGLYYANYFGPLYVDFFGKKRLKTAPCLDRVQLARDAWYLQIADNLDYYKTVEREAATNSLTDHLGRDAFFDISDPFRRCRVPEYVKANRRTDDPLSV